MSAQIHSSISLDDWNIKDNVESGNQFNPTVNTTSGSNSDSSSTPAKTKTKSKSKRSVRAKYSRPCDGCALRKVRCDQKKPCSRCVEHNVPCTDNRLKKKCGPKHIHKKTRDSINSLSMGNAKINTLGSHNEILTLDKLLPCLQIYQTWYYGIWPVLSVAHLVSRIVQLNPSPDSTLSTENATSYSLCCAVCAAITRQLTFLTVGNPIVGVPSNIDASEYAKESIRARNLFDYRLEPSHDNLLISFFLYIYYVNIEGGIRAAILYMKEAISIAQLLGLHDPRTYVNKPAAEVHRLRKIYYMLLVTERFMCIEDNVPVCLEPSIPFPSLEDEEYSGLLTGFIELVKIFSIPDKKFFDNLINYSKKNPSNLNNFSNLFASSGVPNRMWIIKVQNELKKIEIENASSDTQRLNIILSKHWMRALAWHISSQNGLLIKNHKDPDERCLTYQFPIEIAKDFLIGTEDLPIFAFESNGPGVCVKLLEIALAVADSVNECIINKQESFTSYNILTSVFNLVSKFKSDITISQELYGKVESIVNRKSVPAPLYPKSYIREINDDGESIHSDESLKNEKSNSLAKDNYSVPHVSPSSQSLFKTGLFYESEKEKEINPEFKMFDPTIQIPSMVHSPSNQQPQSPFTQMTMAFSLSPSNPMNFENEMLELYQSKQSHQPFQTFQQTHSPSTEQMQQLEMQLQHQFQQFHQNKNNKYQYGSPGPELPGRGSGTYEVQSKPLNNVNSETPEHPKSTRNSPENQVQQLASPERIQNGHISTSPEVLHEGSPHSDISPYASSYGSDDHMAYVNQENVK